MEPDTTLQEQEVKLTLEQRVTQLEQSIQGINMGIQHLGAGITQEFRAIGDVNFHVNGVLSVLINLIVENFDIDKEDLAQMVTTELEELRDKMIAMDKEAKEQMSQQAEAQVDPNLDKVNV